MCGEVPMVSVLISFLLSFFFYVGVGAVWCWSFISSCFVVFAGIVLLSIHDHLTRSFHEFITFLMLIKGVQLCMLSSLLLVTNVESLDHLFPVLIFLEFVLEWYFVC